MYMVLLIKILRRLEQKLIIKTATINTSAQLFKDLCKWSKGEEQK